MGSGRLSQGREKVRHLVSNGVHAEEVTAQDRSAEDLRKLIRGSVELGIVRIAKAAEKEHLTNDDVDLLAKYSKLLNEIEKKQGGTEDDDDKDPAQMSDEQLARQIR